MKRVTTKNALENREILRKIICLLIVHWTSFHMSENYETSLMSHYPNTPVQYTAIFHGSKNVNFTMKIIIFSFFLL